MVFETIYIKYNCTMIYMQLISRTVYCKSTSQYWYIDTFPRSIIQFLLSNSIYNNARNQFYFYQSKKPQCKLCLYIYIVHTTYKQTAKHTLSIVEWSWSCDLAKFREWPWPCMTMFCTDGGRLAADLLLHRQHHQRRIRRKGILHEPITHGT